MYYAHNKIQVMKGSSHKSIPSIERKPHRKFKPPSLALQPLSFTFNEPHQLIFKTQILPAYLELEMKEMKQLVLSITASQVSIRRGEEVCSVPFNLGKSKWLRMVLGQEVKKTELKVVHSDVKMDKNQIFKTLNEWKSITREEISVVNHFHFLPLLGLLKSKIEKKQKAIQIPTKHSIGSFIKTRLSERKPIKANFAPFRTNQMASKHMETQARGDISKTFETLQKRENNTTHTEMRKGSSTLDTDKFMHRHVPSQLKESNTSTTVSGQPDIKFSRRIKKFRQLAQNKTTKSQKQALFTDQSDFFPLKQKPKFYQHFNISQQEVDLKRKKFDSQFICKKQTHQTTKEIAPERNESQVTEQICRMQNSQQMFEDTFEKGFMGNNAKINLVDESGTLYESVYQ